MLQINSSTLSKEHELFSVFNPLCFVIPWTLDVQPGSPGSLCVHLVTSIVSCSSDFSHHGDEPLENARFFEYKVLISLDSMVLYHLPKDCVLGGIFPT